MNSDQTATGENNAQTCPMTATPQNQKGPGCIIGRRLFLLQKIDELGSIRKAAKEVGISYQTALTTINLLNNLARRPLVIKQVGGKKGGGTCLTIEGKLFLNRFLSIWLEHQQLFHNNFLGVCPDQSNDELSGTPCRH